MSDHLKSNHYQKAFPVIQEVLANDWDPIGISSLPNAIDEYDSYIPTLYRLLREDADADKISKHLEQLETVSMGFAAVCGRSQQVAELLIREYGTI